jgi:hypothetical protein
MLKHRSALIAVAVCLFAFGSTTQAQVDEHRFEVGGVFTSITLTDFRERVVPGFDSGDSTVNGIGGRFAYNLNENLAIDAEASFFPESVFGNEESGQKLQGVVGVKAGVRNRWAGVFAKARPGVMWFGEFPSRGSCTTTSFGSTCGVAHDKNFAMDLGGVIEFYPAKRAIIRADIGDTIIHYQDRTGGTFSNPILVSGAFKNNFQVSIGFGWRF